MVAVATVFCFTIIGSHQYYLSNFLDSKEKLFLLHNEHRKSSDIQDFVSSDQLDDYAQKYSETMFKRKRLRHSNINFVGKYRGENIAYTSYDDPVLVFNNWINSRGHRSNIEFILYNKVGIGKAGNDKDGYYWCVVFSD